MPPTLTITGPRAELLRAIADGKVWEYWDDYEPGEVTLEEAPGRRSRVTRKVGVMKTIGLCETDPADIGLHSRSIKLTGAGEKALADYDAERNR